MGDITGSGRREQPGDALHALPEAELLPPRAALCGAARRLARGGPHGQGVGRAARGGGLRATLAVLVLNPPNNERWSCVASRARSGGAAWGEDAVLELRWFYGHWDRCKAKLALALLHRIQACVQLSTGLGLGNSVVKKMSVLTLQEPRRQGIWKQSEWDAQVSFAESCLQG